MKPLARGFTLVELLVALFVTAIVFALGYGAINQALNNRETVLSRQDRLVDLQRTMRLLVQDFSQVQARPVRDIVGTGFEPALKSGSPRGVLVTLTRGGWSNPAGVPRSNQQRVRYVFENGELRREVFDVLDAFGDPVPRTRVLFDGLRAVTLRYMDDSANWRDLWPIPGGVVNPRDIPYLRPRAVEVTLELEDWGKLVRIIEVVP